MDLKERLHFQLGRIRNCMRAVLVNCPMNNAALSRTLGFWHEEGTHAHYITWSLLRDFVSEDSGNSSSFTTGNTIYLRRTNEPVILSNQRAVAFANIRAICQDAMAQIAQIIYEYVEQNPGATNASTATALNCRFDRNGGHKDHITHFVLKHLLANHSLSIGHKYTYSVSGDCVYQPRELEPVRLGSRGEDAVYRALTAAGLVVGVQYRLDGCVNDLTGAHLPFDFIIYSAAFPRGFALIEVDGIQHRMFVEYFHRNHEGFLAARERDRVKTTYCAGRGIVLFRLDYGPGHNPVAQLRLALAPYGLNI